MDVRQLLSHIMKTGCEQTHFPEGKGEAGSAVPRAAFQPRCPPSGAGCGPAAPSPAAAARRPRLLLGVEKDIEKKGGEL